MILTVDAGNTTVSAAVFDSGALLRRGRIKTDIRLKAEDFKAEFLRLLEGGKADGAIFSSVVPGMNSAINSALADILGSPPVVMSPELDTGMEFGRYDPRTLGADRIADTAAAAAMFGVPVIVADMGTCTTLSVVDNSGEFIGGMIMPGIQLSLNAMHSGTAQLPLLKADYPADLVGSSTEACMKSGSVIGAAAAVEGLIERIEDNLGYAVPAVVTGGLGRLALPWFRRNIAFEPDLLFKGLYTLCLRNS